MKIQLAAGCALLLAVGCAHTSESEKETTSAKSGEAAVGTRKAPPKPPPLAGSPSDLLEPASRQKLSEALSSKGFLDRDDATGEQLSAAVRKFQESQGLAATGFPDHETLRRLGLHPEDVDTSLNHDRGRGGSGGEGPGRRGPSQNDTPPSDQGGTGASTKSDSSNSGH